MKKLILLLTILTATFHGQNLALTATSTASGSSSGNYGPSNWNDGILNGTYFGWVGTDPASFASPAYIQYEWATMQTLDCLVVYNPGTNFTPPTGNAVVFNGTATLQEWNGVSWNNITTFSGQGNYGDSYAITFSPVTTTQIRILCTTTAGNHNPGFDEIEVFLANTTQNTYVDLAVTDIIFTIDTPAMEMYVDVEVTNLGTQKAVNFDLSILIGGSMPAGFPVTDSLLPNESKIYSIEQLNNSGPMDISNAQNYANMDYCATVSHPLDTIVANNEMCASLAFLSRAGFQSSIPISIYPNPTAGELFIHSEEVFSTFSLRDMSGRTVITRTLDAVKGTQMVSLQKLAPGQYVVTLEGEAGIVQRKIIVK